MSERSLDDIDQVLEAYAALWEGDFSELDSAAEDIHVRDPAHPDGEFRGRAALEARIRGVLEAFPDFHTRIDRQVRDGDTVMMEWTMTGTHEGEYDGIPPTGEEMAVGGMSTVVVRDGQVQADRLYFDTQEMLAQLGLTEE